MKHSSTLQALLSTEPININDELDFVRDGVAAQEFSEYLPETDNDGENSGLAPT